MTRITFVSYDDVPALGGQGRMLEELRSALLARGHSVSTLAGRGEHAMSFPRRTGRRAIDMSLLLSRRPGLITEHAPDVVHIFGGPGGVLFTRRLPIPVVYHAHHTYRQAHGLLSPKRVPALTEARAYRRADRVLAVSPSTAAAVLRMGVPAAHVEVLPPGIAVRDEVSVQREPGRVLFVGRLEHEKGVLDALTVMERLMAEREGVHGCVIGAGGLAAEVRRRSGGASRIEYLAAVDDRTLHAEYARAAILVMPSRYEGLGRTALEAQAAGTPVVGYAVTGLRDAVHEGGVLVRAGDVRALHEVCASLLDHPSQREAVGERGQEFVRRVHSPEGSLARLEQVYAEVIAAR